MLRGGSDTKQVPHSYKDVRGMLGSKAMWTKKWSTKEPGISEKISKSSVLTYLRQQSKKKAGKWENTRSQKEPYHAKKFGFHPLGTGNFLNVP